MIVVAIMVLVMTGVGLSLGATDRVKLRTSCWALMSGVRIAYSRAVTQGTTTRLVLDFETKTLSIDETKGRMVLNPEDESGEGTKRSEDYEESKAESLGRSMFGSSGTEPDGDGFLNLSDTPTGSFGGASPLSMVLGGGGVGDETVDMSGMLADMTAQMQQNGLGSVLGNAAGYQAPTFKPLPGKRGQPRKLEGSTLFHRVFSPHDPKPREEGRAFIYFFSNGMTEHTFVQLSDGNERIYTVEIHPLTGKPTFYNEEVAPEGDLDDLQEAED